MGLKFFQVDAFTDKAFSGNPAAVFILPEAQNERWMQSVAAEMNLSETAFLYPGSDLFHLRWFTPTREVALCGHATLATAHILWETGRLAPNHPAHFETQSGRLNALKVDNWIELDFPSEPEQATAAPPTLIQALGVRPQYVGKNRFDFLVEVDSEQILRSIRPEFALLASVQTRGVIVTAPAASPAYDFVSRFFAPRSGIHEDPVTGSAHCCLGPFWRERLHKDHLIARQLSTRGGVVAIRIKKNRVVLSGQAVTIFSGQWVV
ncbi:MAG: PhzF family phenazine biosynthesis protein [Nitrospiria bacterium]